MWLSNRTAAELGTAVARVLPALLLGAAAVAEAQGPQTQQCADQLASRFNVTDPTSDPCFTLAGVVMFQQTERLYLGPDAAERLSPRDLQQTNAGDAATGGSVAQAEAVPTVQPMAAGGGSISAVGSDAGAHAITALTLNPAIFFTGSEPSTALAQYSRLSDLTVFFPVDGLDQDQDGDVDYFGIRVRVNVTGLSAGSDLMAKAREMFGTLVQQEALYVEWLAEVLQNTPVVEACVTALLASQLDRAAVQQSCATDVAATLDADAYRAFHDQLAAVREEVDSRYFGLDVRLDVGDPTLGAVPNASATAITGGLAFGKQFVGQRPDDASAGLKARLGLRYTDLEDLDEQSFAVDGGVAFEARRPVDLRRIVTLSGGFEFRFGDADRAEAELQTDFLVFRAALKVPVSDGTGVSIAVGAPLIGERISPSLSVNAHWGLLLPTSVR